MNTPQENLIEPKKEVKKKEKPKAPVYRELSEEEQGMLFAIYDKHSGNVSSMILDRECLFKSNVQIGFYKHKYDFQKKLAKIRKERAEKVIESLEDSKIKALQVAQKLLEPQYQIVFRKGGTQVFDEEGNPVIVEKLPFYKEIKTAWDMIKAELGEPTEGVMVKREPSEELHQEDQELVQEFREQRMLERSKNKAKQDGER